jgi:hypothetical protein
MADSEFAWVDQVPAVCLTFVEGLTPAAVEAALGADSAASRQATFQDAADAHDFAAEKFTVQLGEADGWTVVVEPNGYLCSQDEVLSKLAAKGRAVMVFWNVNMDSRFGYAREGKLVRVFDPVLGASEMGSALPEEAGLPIAEQPIQAVLMLAKALTGVSIDGRWMLEQPRPTVICPFAGRPADASDNAGSPSSSCPQCFVIVYNVSKKHNIGTLLRSCTAFGVAQVGAHARAGPIPGGLPATRSVSCRAPRWQPPHEATLTSKPPPSPAGRRPRRVAGTNAATPPSPPPRYASSAPASSTPLAPTAPPNSCRCATSRPSKRAANGCAASRVRRSADRAASAAAPRPLWAPVPPPPPPPPPPPRPPSRLCMHPAVRYAVRAHRLLVP